MAESFAIDVEIPEGISDEEWRAFLATANLAVVAYAKDRFEPENNQWPQTAWPRLAEFVEDLDDGHVRARSLDASHQTGVATGRMRDSIHTELPEAATVGETVLTLHYGVEYAEKFHEGGASEIQIDRRGLRTAYARQPEVRAFIKEHRLGWLFAKESFTQNQAARPLFDEEEIREVVRAEARSRWPQERN